jgi:hypothetical protein
MAWTLELRREAANYMLDSWPYLRELRWALSTLRNTKDAIPAGGAHQLEPGLLMIEAANHLIVYERGEQERKIIIWAIKPTE